MVSEDGERVSQETLEALVAACDPQPSPYTSDLSALFKDKFCSVESFEGWILDHPQLASFSKWLLEEESPGMDLEGEVDSLNFYQTLSQKYKGESVVDGVGRVQDKGSLDSQKQTNLIQHACLSVEC